MAFSGNLTDNGGSMRVTRRGIGVLAALLGGLCGPVAAQVGQELGVWRPTNARVQQLFGTTWQNLGLGIGPVRVPEKKGGWMPDFQLVVASNLGNRLTMAPVGYSWRKALSDGDRRGYFGITPQAVFVRTEGENLPDAWRTVGGISVLVGQGFGNRFYVEGGYSAVGRVRDLNLSGWNLAAGFRF
jgi:hypothetical protein